MFSGNSFFRALVLAMLCLPILAQADENPRAMNTDEPADAVGVTACSPWDGPAIKIQIARHGKLSCPDNDDSVQDSAHYEVRIYKSWAQVRDRGTRTVLLTSARGSLTDCPGKGEPCKPVENGRVDFFDRRGILHMPMTVMQGMEQSLPFTLRWCEKLSSPCG